MVTANGPFLAAAWKSAIPDTQHVLNPGSVSLPKGGSSRSFGYYDGENLRHYVV